MVAKPHSASRFWIQPANTSYKVQFSALIDELVGRTS
jgi:hypothetical protein